jgi:superfamily II DNA/RNA helicase
MHQGARNRTLDSMRRGQVKVLVATDVAARGIDVPTITHVVNYDLPKFPEDYVHRIGRTGRAGRNGIAVSLVNHAEGINVKRIERFTKQIIPVDVVEGFEPKRSAPARTGARAGWKPGDGRNAAKPGQRSFQKPGSGPREGGFRSEGGYSRDAARPAGGGYNRDAAPRREGAPRDGAPREGGYRGSNPRSADGARRTYGDR